ncbi:MAG: CdaR family protein [Candidatus Auribacterota bacterium]|jgi:YbbR domain-containing protein|nr:CdaR family protein [Candidatus Auribacterota bacterium]
MKNIFLKMLSIVIAIGLWMYITNLVSKEKNFTIPVEIQTAENMISLSQTVEQLNIYVKGPAKIIDELLVSDFRIYKDLSDVTHSGNITIPIEDLSMSLPNNITIERIFPRRITLNLDRIVEKEFKVNVVTIGKVPQGYVEIKEHRVNPTSIKLRGPERVIANIDTVDTKPIDISGLIWSKRFAKVALQEFVQGMALNSDKFVDVTVRIEEETETIAFSRIPVRVLEPVKTPFTASIGTSEAYVVIRGKKEFLDKLTPADIKIYVDITNLDAGVYDLPLEGKAPEQVLLRGVRIDSISPASIEVIIEPKS